ncbi:unnamed protein product [Boreogadus saida]
MIATQRILRERQRAELRIDPESLRENMIPDFRRDKLREIYIDSVIEMKWAGGGLGCVRSMVNTLADRERGGNGAIAARSMKSCCDLDIMDNHKGEAGLWPS